MAMKVGRWLEKQYILVRSATEEGRSYLDPDGYATDTLYEAAFYGSQDEAEDAKSDAKHEGNWGASPLLCHLRDVHERET